MTSKTTSSIVQFHIISTLIECWPFGDLASAILLDFLLLIENLFVPCRSFLSNFIIHARLQLASALKLCFWKVSLNLSSLSCTDVTCTMAHWPDLFASLLLAFLLGLHEFSLPKPNFISDHHSPVNLH